MPIVVTPTVYESDTFVEENKLTIFDNVEFHKESEIQIFGKNIDLKSLYISTIGILFMSLVWYFSGLFKLALDDYIILGLSLILISNFVTQVFTSSTFSGSVTLEQAKLNTTDQLNSVMIGSILVFVVISVYKGKFADHTKIIATITLILSILNSMNFSVSKEGSSIRTLRKLKEAVLNVTTILFAILVYLTVKSFHEN